MNKNDNNEKQNSVNEVKEEASSYDFIREKIKERPINKKRLTRKMLLTASMAFVFGSIACLSFLVLEPVFEKFINKNNQDETVLTQVVLTETTDDSSDELFDEYISDIPFDEFDGIATLETPIENLNLEDSVSEDSVSGNNLSQIVKADLELDDYNLLYRKMYSMGKTVSKSLVVVTGTKKGQDIFNEEHLNTNRTTGLIIAEAGNEILILADSADVPNDNNTVTFCDGYVAEATKKITDEETGLSLYSVIKSTLPDETKNGYTVAVLGNSVAANVLGSPVIALGDPLNSGNSLCYGAVTSVDSKMYVMDCAYQIITTDIFASKKANGIIVNVRGQVIGFICQRISSDGMDNLVTAYGISSIRRLIEDMSNGGEVASLGLYVKDITNDAKIMLGIPQGVYVTKTELESPAMSVGIVPGDIIYSIDNREINSVTDYSQTLRECEINQPIVLGVMRPNGEGYSQTRIEVKPVAKE